MSQALSDSEPLKLAKEFSRSFEPSKNDDYTWVIEHAQQKLSIHTRSIEILDSKAESLMRYFSGLTTVILAAFSYLYKVNQPFQIIALFPSLTLLIISSIMLCFAAKPQLFPTPKGIKSAFDYVAFHKGSSKACFYATYVPLEIALKELIDRKSHTIGLALWCFWAAISLAAALSLSYAIHALTVL